MATIDQLAGAALRYESLALRSLVHDLLDEYPCLADCPRPRTRDPHVLAAAASLVELLASRLGQTPPPWTAGVDPLPEPVHLLANAAHMKHLRDLCESESPEPLRRRGLFAPPNYLEFA